MLAACFGMVLLLGIAAERMKRPALLTAVQR